MTLESRTESSEDITMEPAKIDGSLHGLRLWVVVGGMMLGVYLVGLDMTMLSTVCSYSYKLSILGCHWLTHEPRSSPR